MVSNLVWIFLPLSNTLRRVFPDLKLEFQLYFKIIIDPKLGLPTHYLSTPTIFMGFYPHLPIAHIYLAVLSLSFGEFK
jgi:hypothetical protein